VEYTLPAEAPDLLGDGWKRSRSGGRWRSSPKASLLVGGGRRGDRDGAAPVAACGGSRGRQTEVVTPVGGGGGRGAEARRREAAPQTIHNTKRLNKCCRYHQIGKTHLLCACLIQMVKKTRE
jgi:hypothetical protein